VFFFQAEDGIRDWSVTGVQTCALPIWQKPQSNSWQSAITVVQEVEPPFIPAGAHATTIVIEYPPGHPGSPPHRHSGPIFGYVLEIGRASCRGRGVVAVGAEYRIKNVVT